MLSLAPIRYATVLRCKGGPIERLEYATTQVQGVDCTQAVAFLRHSLIPKSVRPKYRTEQPDGAGSHRSVQVACHMAVSETLERWAVYYSRTHPKTSSCALEEDPSSNGFAAYPGLFKRQARKAAFRESIERHCLICWWEGLLGYHPLPDPEPGLRAIQLDNPFSRHVVVVIWGVHQQQHVYGFGAGESQKHAVWRASVEMERMQQIVTSLEAYPDNNQTKPVTELYERRIRYFSSEAGFLRFLDCLERPVAGKPDKMRLLFDAPVPGPWDRYATVWRTVIKPPSRRYLSNAEDYFFW